MPSARFSREKQRYWERRLSALLRPIPITDLLILSWSIEAFRDGRKSPALRRAGLPGEPEDHVIGGQYFIPPWNIDAVLNERLVIDSEPSGNASRLNLASWGAIAKLFNTYKGLANVESVMDYSSDEVLAALPRLLWPQYDWQLGVENLFRVGRAWHVYVTPEGSQAFVNKHSIDLETFLRIAFAIYASTDQAPAVQTSSLRSVGATADEIFWTRSAIGETLDGHILNAKSIRDLDIPRSFKRSTVKERPLFDVEGNQGKVLMIPSREQLLLRITDGLYYDIVQDSDARRAAGQKFEDLSVRLVDHYCSTECEIEPERDTSYGKSADLFVFKKGSDLGVIVDCKSRRLPQRILTSPDPWRDFEEDFNDIIKGITQVWRTYDELHSSDDKSLVGIVLSYDPWTALGSSFLNELYQRAELRANKLSIATSSRIPVALVGYADLEICLRSYSFEKIYNAVLRAYDQNYRGYLLSGVLNEIDEHDDEKPSFDYDQLARQAIGWWGELEAD